MDRSAPLDSLWNRQRLIYNPDEAKAGPGDCSSTMRKINLRSVDLNLLIILEALLDEKSVTKAADRVFLSQPAMSRSLAKLRRIFDDQLLIKSGRGMLLTPRAETLQDELCSILSLIRSFVSPRSFEPRSAEGKMAISATDAMIVSFLSPTIKNIVFEAPNVHFTLQEPQTNDAELLRRGKLDLLLSAVVPADDLHSKAVLIDNRFSCLVKKEHRLQRQKLTKESFLAEGHIELCTGTGKVIEDCFLKRDYRRRFRIRASSYISACAIAEQTDWIFTVPTVFALTAVRMFNLSILDPPFRLMEDTDQPITLYMVWDERCHSDPMHVWVREMIEKHLQGWCYL